MREKTIVVQTLTLTSPDADEPLNLRRDWVGLALDQRRFGPRKLLVYFAAGDGLLNGVSYTRRTDPPELALPFCVDHFLRFRSAEVAMVLCDERVSADASLPTCAAERWSTATEQCSANGIRLVDWLMCDDQLFLSLRRGIEGAAGAEHDGWLDWPFE